MNADECIGMQMNGYECRLMILIQIYKDKTKFLKNNADIVLSFQKYNNYLLFGLFNKENDFPTLILSQFQCTTRQDG